MVYLELPDAQLPADNPYSNGDDKEKSSFENKVIDANSLSHNLLAREGVGDGKAQINDTKIKSQTRRLYYEAKVGDLVVVPRTAYDTVLIGEFTSSFDPVDVSKHTVYGANHPVPFRKVKWYRADIQKRDFSEGVDRWLGQPDALSTVRPEFKKEIYDLVYSDYTVGEEAAIHINAGKNTTDFLALVQGQEEVLFCAALYVAAESRRLDEFFQIVNDEGESAAINRFYDESLLKNTHININSEGKISLITVSREMTLYISIMLGVFGADVPIADAREVTIENAAQAGVDPCVNPVAEKAKDTLQMMHRDLYVEKCRKRKNARAAVGLDTDIDVEHTDGSN